MLIDPTNVQETEEDRKADHAMLVAVKGEDAASSTVTIETEFTLQRFSQERTPTSTRRRSLCVPTDGSL